MDFNIDLLKKKIIYRSNYRGTKEMDKLLGAFTKKYIDELSTNDLLDLEKLLDLSMNRHSQFTLRPDQKIFYDFMGKLNSNRFELSKQILGKIK